jgi:hypothetical protein
MQSGGGGMDAKIYVIWSCTWAEGRDLTQDDDVCKARSEFPQGVLEILCDHPASTAQTNP